MAFVKTKYEADSGSIHPIKLTTDYASQAGTPPSGAVDSNISAKVTKASSEYGLRPRGVRIARTITDGTSTCSLFGFLAVLTESAWNGAAYSPGATITIGSTAWTVTTRVPEDFN
jgi:hypothetical protein